jgi:molecular chaperone GrpE
MEMSRKKNKDNKQPSNHDQRDKQGHPVKEDSEKQGEMENAEKEVTLEEKIPEEQLLKEKIDELNDKYLRLYSEFDNYRKRTHKERLDLSRTVSAEVITELLPVMDDFERAIKSTAETQDCNAVKEGVNLIFNKFKAILEKKGVKAIDAIGKDFNTDFHEAITYIPAQSDELKNKIVDEVEKGYMLGEKVIRYSKVVIGQ